MWDKSQNIAFFRLVGPEGREVGSLKRGRGAMWRDEKWKSARRCGAKRISKPKWSKTHEVWTTFGSLDVENWHATMAPNAFFQAKMPKELAVSDHFCRATFGRSDVKNGIPLWREAHFQVKCSKLRGSTGGKHSSKSKIQNTPASLEVPLSKLWTPVWRKAHVQVNMYDTHQVQSTPFWREAHFQVRKIDSLIR